MALDIKIEKRKLNFQDDKKEVYVAVPDRNNVIETDKMANEIAIDTGARPAQVKMIINTLTDRMMACSKKVTACVWASWARSSRLCAARAARQPTKPASSAYAWCSTPAEPFAPCGSYQHQHRECGRRRNQYRRCRWHWR